MSTFHLSVKTVSRSAGRTATAAAAYRSGSVITDERTGEIHDYTRKGGVLLSEMVLPPNAPAWATDRATLWNAVEKSETRKNSTVAREWEVAIPYGLTEAQALELVRGYCQDITDRHRIAIEFSLHRDNGQMWDGSEKGRDGYHAHILGSTRRLTADGFGEKSRELDDKKTGSEEVTRWREQWAIQSNAALERAGRSDRIDHRSLLDQGLPFEPVKDMPPQAVKAERAGKPTREGDENRRIIRNRVAAVRDVLKKGERHARKQHRQQTERQERREAPAASVADLRDVWGVDNVHDLHGPENVLQPDAPGHVRSDPPAEPGHRDVHELDAAPAQRVAQKQEVAPQYSAVPTAPAAPTVFPVMHNGVWISADVVRAVAKQRAEKTHAAPARAVAKPAPTPSPVQPVKNAPEARKTPLPVVREKVSPASLPSKPYPAAQPLAASAPALTPNQRAFAKRDELDAREREAKAKAAEPPAPTLAERIAASLAAMLEWIKNAGGRLLDTKTSPGSTYAGSVSHADEHHAVHSQSHGVYVIHRQADLSQPLAASEASVTVKYGKDGRGSVTVKERGGRGGRGG